MVSRTFLIGSIASLAIALGAASASAQTPDRAPAPHAAHGGAFHGGAPGGAFHGGAPHVGGQAFRAGGAPHAGPASPGAAGLGVAGGPVNRTYDSQHWRHRGTPGPGYGYGYGAPGYGTGDPGYATGGYAYDPGYGDDSDATVYDPNSDPDQGAVVADAGSGMDVDYCIAHFKSYDQASGTYLGYDGQRHPCPF